MSPDAEYPNPEPRQQGPLHEASNRLYEAQVARELKRRRRLTAVYILALVIPLFAAGIALVHNQSARDQSNEQVVSAVHEQLSASLPSAIDSAFVPRLGVAIEKELARQTSSTSVKFYPQVRASRAVRSTPPEPKASAPYLARAAYDEAYDMEETWTKSSAAYREYPRLVAQAKQSADYETLSENEIRSKQLAVLSRQVEALMQQQRVLAHRLDSLSRGTFTPVRRDSLLSHLSEDLRTLTPKKLRQQGRALKRSQ